MFIARIYIYIYYTYNIILHMYLFIYCSKSSIYLDFVLSLLTEHQTVSPEKVQPEVKSAIGYSQADSYNNVTYAQQSYLNRPLSCAVDSAGDLIFADFNHRIRTWNDSAALIVSAVLRW